jgi:hypothetical protein
MSLAILLDLYLYFPDIPLLLEEEHEYVGPECKQETKDNSSEE